MRVDDRLIHGQVLLGWGPALHVDRYVIVDDGLAESPFERALFESSAGGIPVEVIGIEAGASRLVELASANGKSVVLLRGLPESLALVRALAGIGGRIGEINLGGLHYAQGRERFHEFVYLDPADRANLRELRTLGVRLFVQDVPASTPFDVPSAWLAA